MQTLSKSSLTILMRKNISSRSRKSETLNPNVNANIVNRSFSRPLPTFFLIHQLLNKPSIRETWTCATNAISNTSMVWLTRQHQIVKKLPDMWTLQPTFNPSLINYLPINPQRQINQLWSKSRLNHLLTIKISCHLRLLNKLWRSKNLIMASKMGSRALQPPNLRRSSQWLT